MGQILPGLDRAQERGLQASMRNAILQNRPQHFCPLLSLVPASPAQDSRPHGMSFPTLSKKTSSRLVWAKEGIQGQTVQLNESPPPPQKGKNMAKASGRVFGWHAQNSGLHPSATQKKRRGRGSLEDQMHGYASLNPLLTSWMNLDH